MSIEIIMSYMPLYFKAFLLTIKIGWIGIALSFILGIIVAFLIHFKVPVLNLIAKFYVELFRNTPLLVQLFFIYAGLPKIGIRIPAEVCGAVGLGLLGGAYMAETFRSGLDAIPVSQLESCKALGMSKLLSFKEVILPQAFSISVPGIVANVIFGAKDGGGCIVYALQERF